MLWTTYLLSGMLMILWAGCGTWMILAVHSSPNSHRLCFFSLIHILEPYINNIILVQYIPLLLYIIYNIVLQSGAPKIAKLVYNYTITRVYGSYNYS